MSDIANGREKEWMSTGMFNPSPWEFTSTLILTDIQRIIFISRDEINT